MDNSSTTPDPDLEKLVQHLPIKGEPVLIVLKGHLLLEELIRSYIDSKLKDPKSFQESKFEFDQCLSLAKALAGEEVKPWVWGSIKSLNTIRNAFAHNLEPIKIQEKLKSFTNLVLSNSQSSIDQLDRASSVGELPQAVIQLYLHLKVMLQFKPQLNLLEWLQKA